MTRRKGKLANSQKISNETIANSWVEEITIGVAILFLSVMVYLNAFNGQFVYDDTKQILENPVVTQSTQLVQALTSDVWAFRGDPDNASSNYWRPTFVLWLIANYRWFGFASTTGWHMAVVFLHAAAGLLVYVVLRQLRLAYPLAAAIAFLFAVHPVHVESVAWISGVTDVLLATALLSSFVLVLWALEKTAVWKWVLAVILYAVAILAKEIGIVFPLLVFFVAFLQNKEASRSRWVQAGLISLPFWGVAILYFFMRLNILGQLEVQTPWRQGPLGLILTAPSLLFFYIRQVLFPYWLGPSYPLRAVTLENWSLWNFWGPLVGVGVTAVLVYLVARTSRVAQIGAAIFLLFLLPALNINAYLPEQLVHDRYLYLPLLGALMVLIPGLQMVLAKRLSPERVTAVCLVAALVALIPLFYQTRQYNTAWSSNLALWEWGIESDPTSMFNQTEYAIALSENDQLPEAKAILDEVLAVSAVTSAYLARAEVNTQLGDLNQAAADLQVVIAAYPNDPRAYERLAVVYQQAGQLDQAIAILQTAREQIPYRRCAFTSNLGVALYLANQKTAALQELESIPALVNSDYTSTCRIGLFHLGQLYVELGNTADARQSFTSFLAFTTSYQDEKVLNYRDLAQQQLSTLGQ